MPTTSDFWTVGVNDSNVVGGPARILVAQRSLSTYPELISDVLDLTTYNPQSGWEDVGHTSEPFTNTSGFDTSDWLSQQAGRINVQIGTWNRTISITPMEGMRDIVMDVVHQPERSTNADGDTVEHMWDRPDVTEWRVVAINIQENKADAANIVMDVFPRCKRSGGDSETGWTRSEPQTHTLEMIPFPDVDVPYNSNWYRIREIAGV
jgi:hypothetical protein